MRKIGLILGAAALVPAASQAATTYNFNGLTAGTVPPANTADAGVVPLGTTTVGQVGTDNWVTDQLTAGFPMIVRNDARPGITGNWVSSYPSSNNGTTAPANYDTIVSRVNTGGANFGLNPTGTFNVSFIASLNPITYTNASNVSTTLSSRSEVTIAYDQSSPTTVGTPDGKIRSTGASAENAEWGPTFGYDSSTAGWYMRPAALGTAKTSAAAGLSGTWYVQLSIDNTTTSDGIGTLYVQQLYDAAGNAATGPDSILHAAGANTTNFALGLNDMTTAAKGGTAGGNNPANWNGFVVRTTYNGGMDDLTVTQTPEPASVALLGLGGLAALRRRRD